LIGAESDMKNLIKLLGASLLCAALCPPAFATLGGNTVSVLNYPGLSISHEVTSLPQFDRHEGVTALGSVIREYTNRQGRVFAVTWTGPVAPDLKSLLGEYAPRFNQAAAAVRASHHVMAVTDGELSVSLLRLPRGWSGRAVLTDSIPDGVAARDIQ
jgi:hypothetical protein